MPVKADNMCSVKDLIKDVESCANEVFEELGPGHKESVYEEGLCHEFRLSGVPYDRQRNYEVIYKGHKIGTSRIDLLVGGELIVEAKALKKLRDRHRNQVRSYYETSELENGILLNFPKGGEEVSIERIPYESPSIGGSGAEVDKSRRVLTNVERAANEIFGILGTKFAYRGDEDIYRKALKVELRDREIPHSERKSELLYKNQVVDSSSALAVKGKYLIKLLIDEGITEDDREEMRLDLEIHGLEKGMLVNFPPESCKVEAEKVRV